MVDYAAMMASTEGIMSLWRSKKPTIAKVHGYAVAGGSDMELGFKYALSKQDEWRPESGIISSIIGRAVSGLRFLALPPSSVHSSPSKTHMVNFLSTARCANPRCVMYVLFKRPASTLLRSRRPATSYVRMT